MPDELQGHNPGPCLLPDSFLLLCFTSAEEAASAQAWASGSERCVRSPEARGTESCIAFRSHYLIHSVKVHYFLATSYSKPKFMGTLLEPLCLLETTQLSLQRHLPKPQPSLKCPSSGEGASPKKGGCTDQPLLTISWWKGLFHTTHMDFFGFVFQIQRYKRFWYLSPRTRSLSHLFMVAGNTAGCLCFVRRWKCSELCLFKVKGLNQSARAFHTVLTYLTFSFHILPIFISHLSSDRT